MRRLIAIALLIASIAGEAHAQIPLGATGPEFTKPLLGGGTVSPSQYRGKVVVMFLLGYA